MFLADFDQIYRQHLPLDQSAPPSPPQAIQSIKEPINPAHEIYVRTFGRDGQGQVTKTTNEYQVPSGPSHATNSDKSDHSISRRSS